MARPLRILLPDCWYHVLNRGNGRSNIFRTDSDRRRFLGLLAELPERFRVQMAAFVLMDNHFHLVLRTLEPNLSEAMRWLQVSYSMRFNWARSSGGHVFQGRFHAIILQKDRDVQEVARYVHLNPVRVERLGLGKGQQQRASVAGCEDPGQKLVKERLDCLAKYPWSSWRVYSGAEPVPGWLSTEPIASHCGGRSRAEKRAALKEYTEEPLRQGHIKSPWKRVAGGLVLGDEDYVERLLRGRRVSMEEQTAARKLRPRVKWQDVVQAAERLRGMSWSELKNRHGEWGRDGAMYFAVRYGGWRLVEVLREMGSGLKYQAAAQGVKRFRDGVETGKDLQKTRFMKEMRRCLGESKID